MRYIRLIWTRRTPGPGSPNHISRPAKTVRVVKTVRVMKTVRVVKTSRARTCCHQALVVLLEGQRKGGFEAQLRRKVMISELFAAVAANKLVIQSIGASSLISLVYIFNEERQN